MEYANRDFGYIVDFAESDGGKACAMSLTVFSKTEGHLSRDSQKKEENTHFGPKQQPYISFHAENAESLDDPEHAQ